MRKALGFAGVLAAAALGVGVSSACATTLYYAGDFDPNNLNADGLANESDGIVSDAATYDNFTITGAGWHVTDLFTNNLTALNVTGATWEIRTGMSQGNGGTLVASGSATPLVTATGRSGFGISEYTVDVSVSLNLAPGTYWMSVVPDSSDASRSYNSNTFGLNSVGVHTADNDYFNSSYFGANFTNADNEGPFSALSDGVLGTINAVPEPATWAMMLIGVGAIGGALRMRPKKAGAAA